MHPTEILAKDMQDTRTPVQRLPGLTRALILRLCSSSFLRFYLMAVLRSCSQKARFYLRTFTSRLPRGLCAFQMQGIRNADRQPAPRFRQYVPKCSSVTVTINQPLPAIKELKATGKFDYLGLQADEDEHSIEMHLPYVRKMFEG